ncbi:MAG TPA: hypothetical protein VF585_03645 [Chthoniobacterales bacterium]|jgi:hypothetical protein
MKQETSTAELTAQARAAREEFRLTMKRLREEQAAAVEQIRRAREAVRQSQEEVAQHWPM